MEKVKSVLDATGPEAEGVEGTKVSFKGQNVFSVGGQQNYCWTRINSVKRWV